MHDTQYRNANFELWYDKAPHIAHVSTMWQQHLTITMILRGYPAAVMNATTLVTVFE